MTSNRRIVAYLDKEDWKTWVVAMKKSGIKNKSKFLKEIVHSWLFSQRILLNSK